MRSPFAPRFWARPCPVSLLGLRSSPGTAALSAPATPSPGSPLRPRASPQSPAGGPGPGSAGGDPAPGGAGPMELMFAEWEDGERFSFEDSDRFEEDSLCSFISEAESLCQNWRGWRKQSAGPNSPTGGGGGGGSGGTRMRGKGERGDGVGKRAGLAPALLWPCSRAVPARELSPLGSCPGPASCTKL